MRRTLALGAASAIVVGAFALASDGRWPWRRLPPAPPAPIPLRTWITHDTLRPGESLAELFGRHGLGPADLGALVERLRLDPRRLRAGLEFRFGHHEAAPGVTDVTYRSATDE
jgi:hypothetical protein